MTSETATVTIESEQGKIKTPRMTPSILADAIRGKICDPSVVSIEAARPGVCFRLPVPLAA
ncbi:MAG: hypothetical protein QOH47_1832 [Sphingomonadales bacterium]|jgi:hypothetical protein|nr:hypothetical protein [Sphingomonadales bacterium]